MKQYRPVEMSVIFVENKDVLTLSNAGQKSGYGNGDVVMGWDQSIFE